MICPYPLHRQMFPASSWATVAVSIPASPASASPASPVSAGPPPGGWLAHSSRTMPGAQKPHWKASAWAKASRNGPASGRSASPSMVMT
ncbi:MAG TPA: hypothetical protein VGI96_21170 [Streptosporangiaceae bacterium]|jgi:hypothetical protein